MNAPGAPEGRTSRVDLEITCFDKGADKVLLFRDTHHGREEEVVLGSRIRNALSASRASLPKDLERFHSLAAKAATSENRPDWRTLSDAVAELRTTGDQFLHLIAPSPMKQNKLVEIFSGALPFASYSGKFHPGRVEIAAAEADLEILAIPLELMPIFDAGEQSGGRSIQDGLQLERALLTFLGFSCIISHRISDKEIDQRKGIYPSSDGTIPVKIIRYEDFYQSNPRELWPISEVYWFQGSAIFALECWPDNRIANPAATELLGRRLRYPRGVFGQGAGSVMSDQIQHFSCHYLRDSEGHDALGLRRRSGSVEALDIRLRSLISAIASLNRQGLALEPEWVSPMVFLNACGSGKVDPGGSLSLLELLLLSAESRAVVTTETSVDYPLAAQFACFFYIGIVSGLTLGEALHFARWKMVDERFSPFGILYTIYGDPELNLVMASSSDVRDGPLSLQNVRNTGIS